MANRNIDIKLRLIIKQFIDEMKKAGLDTTKLEKSLKDVETQSKKTGKTGKESIGKMDKSIKDTDKSTKGVLTSFKEWRGSFTELNQSIELGRKVLSLFRKGMDLAVLFKNASRDAEETGNKFDEVFSSIKVLANETASVLADSFGLADSTAKKLLSSTGDILVGFGFAEEEALDLSKQVVELSQDLASFTNMEGGAERATEALTKAVVGETESVKAMGIVIRQGTKEFKDRVKVLMETRDATEVQARSLAILEIAQKQSTKAIGDYARTQDSLANVERKRTEKLKELYETLGNKLQPAFLELNKLAIDFINIALGDEVSKVNEAFLKQQVGLNILVQDWERLRDIENKTEEELADYQSTVDALQKQYPTYLKNINFESDGYDKITQALKLTNLELENKYILMIKEAEQAKLGEKIAESRIELFKEEQKQREHLGKILVDFKKDNADASQDEIEAFIKERSYYGGNLHFYNERVRIAKRNVEMLVEQKKESDLFYESLFKNNKQTIIDEESKLAQVIKVQNFMIAFSNGDYGKAMRSLNEDTNAVLDTIKDIPTVKIAIEIEDEDEILDEDGELKLFKKDKYEVKVEVPPPPAPALDQYEVENKALLKQQKNIKELYGERKEILDELSEYGIIKQGEYFEKLAELRERYKIDEDLTREEETLLFIEDLESKLEVTEQFLNAGQEIAGNLSQIELNNIDKKYKEEKKLLAKKLKAETITKAEYDKQIILLDQKKAEEEKKIKEKQKKWSYATALIDGAQAITSIWAEWSAFPIVAGILTGLAVATTGTQLGVIASTTYGRGGISEGASHSEGGIDLIERRTGKHRGNIEGGEGIVNKVAMRNPIARARVSAINQEFGNGVAFPNTASLFKNGGVTPRTYQTGGVTPSVSTSQDDSMVMNELRGIREAIEEIEPPQITVINESDNIKTTVEVMETIGDLSRQNLDTDEIMQIGNQG